MLLVVRVDQQRFQVVLEEMHSDQPTRYMSEEVLPGIPILLPTDIPEVVVPEAVEMERIHPLQVQQDPTQLLVQEVLE
jgi:hypothetical protein